MRNRWIFPPIHLLLSGYIGIVVASCGPETTKELPVAVVESAHGIPGFASGSGMAILRGHYWAAGDDDPYLWQLDASGDPVSRHAIWDTSAIVNGRIPKEIKPDFEAIAIMPTPHDTALVVFGSGSKSPQRDVLIAGNPTKPGPVNPHSRSFYTWLRQAAGLNAESLNLEGAACHAGTLILLNRANNNLYQIPWNGFIAFLESGDVANLSLQKYAYTLPKLQNHTATFSGAAMLADENTLLFSASVEMTGNPIDDGKILGSFVGTIDMASESLHTLRWAQLQNPDGTPFAGKLEALEGMRQQDGTIHIVGITDNDDGTTEWLKISATGI